MVNPNLKATVPMLKEIKLLQTFSDAELAQLIMVGATATYEPHTDIVTEGELSWGLYLLLDGVVGILKTNKMTGEHYDVGQLRPGTFFGEMSLVDENPRSATVRSLSECHLFYISKDAFSHFLEHSADRKVRFFESCIRTLVPRLRDLDDNYVISQYQLWKTALKKEAA
jgi:CRP/FNR family cyclic AMP-dependent transcriptional regulator